MSKNGETLNFVDSNLRLEGMRLSAREKKDHHELSVR